MAITVNGKKFEDQNMACQDCGRDFVFTAGEQEFFESKGFTPPKRCKPCRKANKQEKDRQRMEREMPDEATVGPRGRKHRRNHGA